MRQDNEKYKNKFNDTKSQQSKFKRKIQNFPKSKHYRESLEPLLGAVVKLESDNWTILPNIVDGNPCDRLLLKSASVKGIPKNRKIQGPIQIGHIWTLVDEEWRRRVQLEEDSLNPGHFFCKK